jgi:hypothetical protein
MSETNDQEQINAQSNGSNGTSNTTKLHETTNDSAFSSQSCQC